jgi:hypothetical protein
VKEGQTVQINTVVAIIGVEAANRQGKCRPVKTAEAKQLGVEVRRMR